MGNPIPPLRPIEGTFVAVYVSPGVPRDGDGFIVLPDGRIIRIPPRGPDDNGLTKAILASIATIEAAEGIGDSDMRQQIQALAAQTLVRCSQELKTSLVEQKQLSNFAHSLP